MVLEWWNDIVRWFNSNDGWTIISGTILPLFAILAGGIIAGLITRSAIKRLMTQHNREYKASAIAALIASGRRAAVWNTLSAPEKDHVEHQISVADVTVRLLPLAGSTLAADWAAHHILSMKKNSANFSFQAEQTLGDLQDGLIAWQDKPGRAKKLFAQDLAAWSVDAGVAEDELVVKQREWAAEQARQASAPRPAATQATTPTQAYSPQPAAAAALRPARAELQTVPYTPPRSETTPVAAATPVSATTRETSDESPVSSATSSDRA